MLENLRYFARILDVDQSEVDGAVETVGLGDVVGRPAGSVSGGQLARISLASALLGKPDVLVLDEPTVGLDPVLRRDLWATFRRLAGAGATILVSSHVMDEAARCDLLLLMREGAIIAADQPGMLLEQTEAESLDDAFLRLIERGRGGVSARVTFATALRVLTQLRRDPRTIVLLMLVPLALVTLLKYVLEGQLGAFDRIAGPLLGLFPFMTMFIVTSITMLRERTTGTLERLMTMPLAKVDLLAGSALAVRRGRGRAVRARLDRRADAARPRRCRRAKLAVVALAVERAARDVARPLRQRVRDDGVRQCSSCRRSSSAPAPPVPRTVHAARTGPRPRGRLGPLPLTYAYGRPRPRQFRADAAGARLARDVAVTLGVTRPRSRRRGDAQGGGLPDRARRRYLSGW